MFTSIDSLPAGILGVEARGRVSRDDRHAVLAPQIETALRKGKGKVKLLYVAGTDFAGYDEGAPFDEAVFGTRHFNAFERIAFVSDDGRHARAVEALDGLMPAMLRRFDRRELDAAKAWLTE
jgi:hypothetical protein